MTTLGDVIYWVKEVWALLQPLLETIFGYFSKGEETPAEDSTVDA